MFVNLENVYVLDNSCVLCALDISELATTWTIMILVNMLQWTTRAKNTMLVNVSVQTMPICWNAFLEKSNITAIAQQHIAAIVAVIVFLVICLLNQI